MQDSASPGGRIAAPAGTDPEGAAHAEQLLRALYALLLAESDDAAAVAKVLTPLHAMFDFDQAIALDDNAAFLQCVAALPAAAIGCRVAESPLLAEVAGGRVVRTTLPDGCENLRDLPGDWSGGSALCLPIGVGGRRGALIMRRAAGRGGFDAGDEALARQFGLLASAALALRTAGATEAELRRLRGIVEDLGEREQIAQHNSDLLREIVDLLPVSLTVQDEDGRFVLVNSVAEANSRAASAAAIGAAASAAPTDAQATELAPTGELVAAAEEKVVGPRGERTWLTSRKPVRILDKTLLLSTSLDITERKHIESELVRRAYFDDLTGLPNRALIQEHVVEALRCKAPSQRLALAFIDLDNFKHINDYYSHAVGDALLIKAAQRITDRIRATDRLARISGDEFVLLIDPVESEEELREIIDGILTELKRPFQIEGFEVFTSASVGVSIYPEHGGDYETLRRNADNAMYRAKSNAKGDAVLFDLKMGRAVTARMELEQRLRLAIRDFQFCCAFQPKIDIRSQRIIGFETLIRWRDEQGEIQPPSAFVGLATELGLIDSITLFVLAEALKSVERLDAAFGPDTTISINVAAKQAGDVKFMRSLAEALQASGCADRLMIELTEDAFVAKNHFQLQVLPILRDIGTRVSIDDFGTGYSSLSALADITADEIKVDRSFVTAIHQRPRSQSVLRTIESLSDALGMTVIAEGVETFEELAYLQGCTRIRYAQGFYFAKPFFLDDFVGARRAEVTARVIEAAREQAEIRGFRSARMAPAARSRG